MSNRGRTPPVPKNNPLIVDAGNGGKSGGGVLWLNILMRGIKWDIWNIHKSLLCPEAAVPYVHC